MKKQSDAILRITNYYLLCFFSFKTLYGRLKYMKTEIEHMQHLLEKAKVQLQKDFDVWWKQQTDQVRIITPHIVASSISRRRHRRDPPLFDSFLHSCHMHTTHVQN